MEKITCALWQISWVGEIIAARFVDVGIVGFEKIVSSGENVLTGIKKLNTHALAAILEQAAELASAVKTVINSSETLLNCLVNTLAARTRYNTCTTVPENSEMNY